MFLLQIMFSSVLYKRLPAEAGISVMCVSPGIVQTNVVSIVKLTIMLSIVLYKQSLLMFVLSIRNVIDFFNYDSLFIKIRMAMITSLH